MSNHLNMPLLSPRSRQSGQAALMTAMSIPVLLGILGLVVDIGWDYWRAEACKTAATAAAMAAARQAQLAGAFTTANGIAVQSTAANCPASPTSPPSNNLMAGCLYAQQNGFVNSGKQLVRYTAGTTGSPVAGSNPSYWVRFTVTEKIPTLFASVLGYQNSIVSAKSTAGVFSSAQGACIYALDPNANSAISLGGNTDVEAGCGVYDNSSSATALTCSNNTTLDAQGAAIDVTGGANCRGTVTPAPTTNQPTTADPFANVPAPSIPARCDSSGLTAGTTVNMPSDGKYVICGGGIDMTGNGSLSLPAGIYILTGGGINWHNGSVSGSGVTIYMTGPSPGGTTINGNMVVNLSAPTSGTYRGMVIYRDRTLLSPPSDKFNGGATMNFNGTIYVPGSAVTFNGGNNSAITALIADTISFIGTSNFGADTNGAVTGIGVPTAALIE